MGQRAGNGFRQDPTIAEPGRGVPGLRIGLVEGFHEDGRATDAVTGAIEQALAVFRSLGATTLDVPLSPLEDYRACSRILVFADAFALPIVKRELSSSCPFRRHQMRQLPRPRRPLPPRR